MCNVFQLLSEFNDAGDRSTNIISLGKLTFTRIYKFRKKKIEYLEV